MPITGLGWCIMGPIISMVGKNSIGCNRVAVKDAVSSSISHHHFAVGLSLEKTFQMMYLNKFHERNIIKLDSMVMKNA